eukprot:g12260.t1
MCADISGFTALSEKHCKKGTAGLDTLVQIINSYYSNLVNIVYSFGGDIIKIAGDALYCVFMPDEHDLRGAVLCAALCSMQLREVAADGLTLHVGISCGELCFGILGGIDNYWECLMSGEPIGLVADALDEAKKQEVVVSVECMSIIGDCCRGTPLPSRNVLLNALEPPRREKRGSVRMANMIANKGLPVELEPTEGLFAGRAAAAAAAVAATADVVTAAATVNPGAEERVVAGKPPGTAATRVAAAVPGGTDTSSQLQPKLPPLSTTEAAAAAASNLVGASVGGAGAGRTPEGRATGGIGGIVDANAAWISSNAKAKERAASKVSDQALGAAGKMRAEVSSGVLPMLQGFVPGPVTDLLAAGIFMYMAEMRTVTTLFVKLDSYSPEKHKNLLSLQIHLTTIQKILAEHEGFLRQFLVDDKALCGRMGGKIRSEYAMVGDVINLAARLMGKAKGRIVCDEVTHDLVNACLDLIDKGDNVDNPEPSVVVIEGAHGTGKSMVADRVKKSASQFFRRKVHMYAMVQTQSGTPYAGIKGMLRTIFGLDHLGDDAFAVKQALLKTVRDVYGSAEPSTLEVAIRAIKAALGIDLGGETEMEILRAARRPSLGGMLPLHVVHSVISELATHALGNMPAVFILDNVHLMDKMSWKLLIQFLYCPLRLLLVLTATPVEEDIKKRKDLFHAKKKGQIPNLNASMPNSKERAADGPNSVWHGDHGETHLHMQQYIRATQLPITKKFTLSPFSKEELRQLLEHTLAPRDRAGITEELVDTVYGLSGGNPYWCVEVVRFIKENSVGIFMSRIAVQEDGAGGTDVANDGSGGAITSTPEDAMMGRMGILVVCRFERLLVEEQVLFVHHYISMMHELGHTTVRHVPDPADGTNDIPPPDGDARVTSDSRANSNATYTGGVDGGGHRNGRRETDLARSGATPTKPPGDRETPDSVNGHGNIIDDADGGDNEGLGGVQPPLVITTSKATVAGSVGEQERRPVYSDASKAPADEGHSGSLNDVSRRTIATDVDDEHADSLRKHPVPITARPPKLASTGGASDYFEEEAGMLGEGEGEDDGEREDSFSTASVHDARNDNNNSNNSNNGRGVSRRYLPGHEEETTSLHSSLGWELAHLLHVCLGNYIKPGGGSPGFPEAADGTYSISTHRLPPEAGEAAGVQPEVTSEHSILMRSWRIGSV